MRDVIRDTYRMFRERPYLLFWPVLVFFIVNRIPIRPPQEGE